ncbi:hypothetical protein ABZP36_019467 [Zizania latifolia]
MAHALRIQCRASDEMSLAIVNGEVILANADPRDDRQARPNFYYHHASAHLHAASFGPINARSLHPRGCTVM